ncbi:DNA-binding transcriptional regulator [Aporhodopirellula aestuarii]|uniref:DNA-binding transcriptional regulator n=1 Tax=Aporhodopirellula aestuarii TaxID=2950107 RepID=A0ABT0U165_9BACT|nr:DNA-binding transcriptional regulator [Aporhodopirellula aestuarii]MCM2370590.1 DNA-binding transcriptional regulator [Aporhodopirellula aestuarii]
MNQSKAVTLLVENSNSYTRSLLQGIASYMNENETWSIYLSEHEIGACSPDWLARWKGDGIIARTDSESVANTVQNLDIPAVAVNAAEHLPRVPYVEINESGVAQMAFEHLRQCGFESYAFCGEPGSRCSTLRSAAFAQCVEEAGFKCHRFDHEESPEGDSSTDEQRNRLARWLRSLPMPIGLFAVNDEKAQQVLTVCRSNKIRVPEQIAVLGVNNDEVLCDLCTPSLSSVILAGKRVGYEAAKNLDRLMRGEELENACTLVDPMGIAMRQSTDVLAIEDKDIAVAVRFIRDHHCDGINVQDVVAAVSVSRRSLESRFQARVGRTLHQEITRRRISRVCQLLNETGLTLAEIAQRTGYQNEEYMSVAFRRAMNMPPGRYRRGR